MNNFDLIILFKSDVRPFAPANYFAIALDSDAFILQPEMTNQAFDGYMVRNVSLLAVDLDTQVLWPDSFSPAG